MFKNFTEISKIEDEAFKKGLLGTRDHVLLEKLKLTFPEYFSKERVPVKFSLIGPEISKRISDIDNNEGIFCQNYLEGILKKAHKKGLHKQPEDELLKKPKYAWAEKYLSNLAKKAVSLKSLCEDLDIPIFKPEMILTTAGMYQRVVGEGFEQLGRVITHDEEKYMLIDIEILSEGEPNIPHHDENMYAIRTWKIILASVQYFEFDL